MTYKEAINAIQLDGMEITTTAPRMLAFSEGLKKAEEVLEKAERYKKHDLRKDPNDLPDMYEDVYVFDGSSYFVWSRVPLEDSWIWEDDYGYYSDEQDDVIAWRRIEPF